MYIALVIMSVIPKSSNTPVTPATVAELTMCCVSCIYPGALHTTKMSSLSLETSILVFLLVTIHNRPSPVLVNSQRASVGEMLKISVCDVPEVIDAQPVSRNEAIGTVAKIYFIIYSLKKRNLQCETNLVVCKKSSK